MAEKEIAKCLDVTASLVLASIQNGKFEAKDGQSVANFFGQIFGKVCDCANLTAPEFIEEYTKRKEQLAERH